MKRGKDDETLMGPMFPRLHVNDTEKGGPRAPPRNKMALYEQLTIPSPRYNAGLLPHNLTRSSLVSSSSTTQGPGHERDVLFPLYQSPLTPTDLNNNLPVHHSDVTNLSSRGMQAHRRKKPLDEDDFRVPIFSHSEKDQHNYNGDNSIAGGRHNPASLTLPSTCSKETNQSKNVSPSSRQGVRNLVGQKSEELASTMDHTDKFNEGSSSGQLAGSPLSPDGLANQECHKKSRLSTLQRNSLFLQQDHDSSLPAETTSGKDASVGSMKDTEMGLIEPKLDSHAGQGCKVTDVIDKGSQSRLEKHGSSPRENLSRGDDVFDSMVESISGFDITPDDVVGVIGLKHFWEARKAIADQQRVFAFQVFELHRLIKVQRLIAGSPHILLEPSAYEGRPPLKDPSVKKLVIDCAANPPPYTHTQKDDSQRATNYRIEGSAENSVGKGPSCSPQNAAHPSKGKPLSGNRPSSPVKTDTKNPWCFPQASGHQWLVPVMSPSEGLVYKPYPAAGFMGPIYGSCGPPVGPTPVMSSFTSSAYGVPASPHYQQGAGFPPGAPFNAQTYFPPYGMQAMNPSIRGSAEEQMNQLTGSDPNGQAGQFAGDGSNFSIQHRSSCNMQSQKNEGNSDAVEALPSSRDGKMRGSTASSPSESLPVVRAGPTSEGRDAGPLFPAAPAPQVSEKSAPPHESGRPTRVIRVVPHNRRSASESANRIFQSIQHERQQQESN